MLSAKTLPNFLVSCALLLILLTATAFAETAPLEIDTSGRVNINTILNLKPQEAPSNPVTGDIYFTTDQKLVIFANGGWNIILEVPAVHGSEHFTSGSGTWTVPNGVTSIEVSLVGGGGGGGGGTGGESEGGAGGSGGNGGNGGVIVKNQIAVTPGQTFSYSIGSGGNGGNKRISGGSASNGSNGGTTNFGNLSASGGSRGTGAGYDSSGSPGSSGSPQEGSYPGGSSYGKGGSGGSCLGEYQSTNGSSGNSGAIFIEY